jgi:zinc/manganese transport system substrate-binding protein
MNAKWLSSVVFAGILLLAASPAWAKLKVVASLSDLAWIAEQVGGDDAEVSVLCPGHYDPHYLPAKPSLTRKLRTADLLVFNGLELEIGWLPLLIESARNPRIMPGTRGEMDCSQALTAVLEVPTGPVDRSQGDIHPLGNPHYLSDPRNGIAVGRLMARRMGELDPSAADRYRRRAEELASRIEGRLPAWKRRVETAVTRPIVVYTKHWEYLADWLGFEIIGAIEHRPGITPSPRHVEELIRAGRKRGQVIVIATPWDHIDAARNAAQRMGAQFVVLPGAVQSLEGAEGYLGMFDVICSRLAKVAGSS